MQVIATTNNPVRMSFLTALLADAGIAAIVLDMHASVMDGSIGALPRRIMVADGEAAQARRILAEANEI
ncbi:MAG: DUF2007 domain-containing protein [Acetobacteraceae bacterium]|nr:DUF2007 domain-containing protein [Acetobacteraceae bacterium]